MSQSKDTPSIQQDTSPALEAPPPAPVTAPTSEAETTAQEQSPPTEGTNEDSGDTAKNPEPAEETASTSVSIEGTPASTSETDTTKPKSSRDVFKLDEGLKEIEALADNDAKVVKAIELMERSIGQSGAPNFRSFWELRKLSMQLFKENITPAIRPQLWERFTELTKEARQLKEILDEQTAFAVEQIEIAIVALEKDLGALSEQLTQAPPVDFGASCESLKERLAFYDPIQRELSLLNAHAGRVNALRKELVKTDMRVRQKNKFFQRLSAAGDLVFPRRKELIKEISEQFIKDIDTFVKQHFTNDDLGPSLFFLREEIKALQSIAKTLTLNTHSFTHTRSQLSKCWNRIKGEEKERKKERLKKKAVFKENCEAMLGQIDTCAKAFSDGELSLPEARKRFDELNKEIRSHTLGKDEQHLLREHLHKARSPITEALKAEEEKLRQAEKEREQARRDKIDALEQRIQAVLDSDAKTSFEEIESERDAITEELKDKDFNRSKRIILEKRLKPVRDLIAERREQALLSLSKDDQESLQQLRSILEERRALRKEIKTQLEQYRKAGGSSGLDFEQAIEFNELQNIEKERLDKTDAVISEIETKISELKDKI